MIREENGKWVVTLTTGVQLTCDTKEQAYRIWRNHIGRIEFKSAGATRKR